EDYYSLYGIFASSEEPKELPVLGRPGSDAAAREFEQKLAELQGKADAFVASKVEAVQADLRAKAPAYWMAAFDLEFQAGTRKLADRAKADSLPRSRLRWQVGRWATYLENAKKANDPVFAPWHALAALPGDAFAARASEALAAACSDAEHPANAVILRSLR